MADINNQSQIKLGVCGLCGWNCLIDAKLEHDEIVSVRKATERPHVKGNLCVRGAALKQYLYHPDRLSYPMKRTGPKGSGCFERITWEEAFEIIATRLTETKEKYGAKSTVFYGGHPKWYRQALAELASAYGSPNFCTESSTCRQAAELAMKTVFGAFFNEMDSENCATALVWTRNPAQSEGGNLNSLRNVKKRGGNVIVVDPRVTPTTVLADLHLRLIPGTDGALALSIANVIIEEELFDKDFIEKYTYGFEQYKDYVKSFTPKWAEGCTGVPAEKIIKAAHIMGGNGPVSLMCSSSSVVHCINGVQNFRAVLMLLALTGSIDRIGGNHAPIGPRAVIDTNPHNLAVRPDIGDDISGGRFPVWNDIINNEAQCIRLADNILSEDPYPIKNLISFGMNPGMFPQSDRLREALKEVEFSVAVDLFMTEACKMADIVLPAAAMQERDTVVPLKDNYIALIPKLIEPGERRTDVDIVIGIAKKLGLEGKILNLKPNTDDYLNYILRPTGLSAAELRKCPEGMLAKHTKTAEINTYLKGLNTPTGKVEFVSTAIEKYRDFPGHNGLPVYTDWRDVAGDRSKYPFILTTGARKTQFFHSRTYRLAWLQNLEQHTLAEISRSDAERLNITDGDLITIETPTKSMSFYACIDDGVMEGVVHVCHGDPEMDVNSLTDGEWYDPISGFPGFKSQICNLIGGNKA